MTRSALALILSLTAVFISGGAVGVLGYRFFVGDTPAQVVNLPPAPDVYRRNYVEMMTRMLELTDEQVEELRAIMDRTRQSFEELNTKTEPEMQAIMQRQLDETNALLTEEQQATFQEFLARRSEFRGRDRGGRGDRSTSDDRRGGRDNRPPPPEGSDFGAPPDGARRGRGPAPVTPPIPEDPTP